MERWRHFAENAGRGGVIKTIVLHAGILTIAIFATLDWHTWTLPPLAIAAWVLPALLRKRLAAHPETTQRFLNIAAIILMASAFGAGFVREHLDDEVLLHAVVGALSAYCSAYFWFLSDPDVVRL